MSRTTSRTARTSAHAARTSTRSARRLTAALAGGTLVLGLTAAPALAAAPTAMAAADATSDPTGGTVTITVDAAALATVCDRIPQVTERATALIARIQGDAGTAGSAAALSARADQATAEGYDDLARRLRFRAEQRLGHVDEITTLLDKLHTFDANVCSQVAS